MHVMHHTTNIFYTCTLILCIANFGVSADKQGSGIVYTADRRKCQNITWKLENKHVYVNVSGVLKRGDGKERNEHGGLPTAGLVNTTTSKTEICCPGFNKNHKGRCKRCSKGTYGLDCMNKCNCTDAQKCDRKTGECKKCKKKCEDDDEDDDGDDDRSTVSTQECPELTYGLNCSKECRCLSSEKCNQTTGECKRCDENPAVTKCYEETIKGTTQTRIEPSSTLTIATHTTLSNRQKMKTISSTNGQVDVSVFPTAEERNQDPKQAFQHGDASTPVIAVSVVIPIIVIIIILALLVKRYHGGYNFKKRGTTESVHKLMSESSHTTKLMNESHELTQVNTSEEIMRGDSYKDVDGNRVYISMYNAMNVDIRHEDSDMERKSKDLQYISMHLQYLTKSTRQSIPNDNETVASK